jgi:hypothetical protein
VAATERNDLSVWRTARVDQGACGQRNWSYRAVAALNFTMSSAGIRLRSLMSMPWLLAQAPDFGGVRAAPAELAARSGCAMGAGCLPGCAHPHIQPGTRRLVSAVPQPGRRRRSWIGWIGSSTTATRPS